MSPLSLLRKRAFTQVASLIYASFLPIRCLHACEAHARQYKPLRLSISDSQGSISSFHGVTE